MRRFGSKTSVLTILAAVLVLYSPFWLGGRVFVPQDFLNFVYPWKPLAATTEVKNPDLLDIPTSFFPIECFLNKSLKRGDIPLWDPEIFCGHPIFASGQSGLFYPPKLFLHYLFSPEVARTLSMMMHTAAAGLLMWYFLGMLGYRTQPRLLGSTVWILNGQMVGWAELDHIMLMATYLPAMLICFEWGRRGSSWGWPLLGLSGAACLHSGHLQLAFYAGLALIAYALVSFASRWSVRHFLSFLGAGVLVGLLAAPTLIPFKELLDASARQDLTFEGLKQSASSLPALLLTLVNPDALGNPTSGFMINRVETNLIYAEFANYLGILPLILLLSIPWHAGRQLTRKKLLYWHGFALTMLLFANASPLYWVVTQLFPPLAKAIPGRSLLAFAFAGALLACDALQGWLENPNKGRLEFFVGGFGLLFLGTWTTALGFLSLAPKTVLEFLAPLLSPTWLKLPPYQPDPAIYSESLLQGVWSNYVLNIQLAIVILGLGALFFLRKKWSPERLAGLMVGMTFLELAAFFWVYTPTVPRDQVLPTTPGIEMLQQQSGAFRVEKYAAGFYHLLTPYGLQLVTGYDSVIQLPVFEAFRLSDPEKTANMRSIGLRDFHHPLLSHAGLRFLMVGPRQPNVPEDWPLVFDEEVKIFENPRALPRVYLAAKQEAAENIETVMQRLAEPGFRHGQTVLTSASAPKVADSPLQGEVMLVAQTPDFVKARVQANRECWLVLNDAYYKGWKASIEGGQELPIYRANGIFRGVIVPAGEHVINFSFEPESLKLGLKMAGVGFILMLLWGAVGSFRKRS